MPKMGKVKYLAETEELFRKSPVVSFSSIERIVKKTGKVKQYAKQLTRNLLLRGKIKRLTKGFYTYYDDPSLAVFCFRPAYLGLQDALSFHNLWEQETIPVVVTAKTARQGIRKVLGMNVSIRRLEKKYFFGFDYYKHDSFYLPYSDIEKTFIDMVYFRERLSQEAIASITKKIDKKKLASYLKVYPKIIQKRVSSIVARQRKK